MREQCSVCSETVSQTPQYCRLHHRALIALESAFHRWRLAYSDKIDRKAFLETILQLPKTGGKVREVATFLLRKDFS